MGRLFWFVRSRRKPLALLLAYLAASWLVFQLLDALSGDNGLPGWAASATFVVLGSGLVAITTIVFRQLRGSAAHELAAIWFADIANYSELMARDEARVMVLVQLFRGIARRTVRDHDGRLVKFMGDGALAHFRSTHSAVEAALHFREEYRRQATESWGEPPPLRIGVHVGDVAQTEDGDLYGDGVNVASRIERAAEPGQVLVSADVWHQLRQNPAFRFEQVEHPPFKGVADVQVFEVDGSGSGEIPGQRPLPQFLPIDRRTMATTAGVAVLAALVLTYAVTRNRGSDLGADSAIASAATPGIVVLPFSVTGDELEGWDVEMVDLLSTNLDGVTGLRTIDSRTVVAIWDNAFGDDAPELDQILTMARRTGARYGVVGRALSVGNRVRMSADIYELGGEGRIGSATVEGVPDSLFQLVDRLSIELVQIVPVEAGSKRGTVDLARITTDSLSALKAYLEGQQLYRHSNYNGAFELYERATQIDSTFALAYYMQGLSAGWGGLEESAEYLKKAARHLNRLPPREALIVRGILALHSGSLESRELVEQAIRRYPGDHETWAALGEVYFHLGPQLLMNPMTADSAFERARRIDPTLGSDYQHLIDNAFGLHASADRARAFVTAYDTLAPGSREAPLYRLGYQLAFGDSNERQAGWQTIDTLPGSYARFIARNMFWHPSLLALSEAVFATGSASDPDRAQGLASVRFSRGRVAAAFEELSKPEVGEDASLAFSYLASAWGMPVPASHVDRVLTRIDLARATPEVAFFVGAFGVDRDRRADVASARERLAMLADSLGASGDRYGANFAAGAEKALAGYERWRLDGRSQEALGTLIQAQREATGYLRARLQTNTAIRIWLSHLAIELGDLPTAERYLGSFYGIREPFASSAEFELARVLDRQERFAEAEQRYARVLTAWSAADPVFENRLQLARSRLEAIREERARRD
ncbi:MAG TPA: adenylate/guanylate cyclase domain-containing protein [Gemmatimonadota bacterium]|nr:adenylate/guanylate cyclase domain-containing protein [Gemmatimonadota bacterium]